jgi:Mce-associated membrane protein
MTRSRPIAGERARARLTGTSSAVLDPPAPLPSERTESSRPPRPARPARAPRLGGWSTRAKALLAGLLVLTLTALTALGLVALRVRSESRVEAARGQAVAAAHDSAEAILSYDYRHLDGDFAAARKVLTGGFARDYAATTSKVVRPGAEQYHAVVKAEVAASSVVRASAEEVVVLLFVNQTTTSTRLDGPRVDLNRVRLTLVKVDGTWLVNNVVAL